MKSGEASFEDLRRSVVAARVRMMPELFARMALDAAALADLQRGRLRHLLERAVAHSPFYARRLRGIDPARIELEDLSSLAVVSKAELMHELDDVFTDRRLSRALVEDALARTTTSAVPILGAYVAQATGGSSGRRGVFVSDVEPYVEANSFPIRALLAHRMGGVPPVERIRIALVAAATAVHSTALAVAMNDPEVGPASLHSVPVTLPLGEIVAGLNELRPHEVVGYPSVLARLAAERNAGRLSIEPMGVSTTSETLTPELRAAIRRGFGVPIIDLFGSTEGLMGHTEPDGSVFIFNSDTCMVELVDDSNRPVPAGTTSAHVLVTNLANTVQPLIRYRIEDRFTRHPDEAGRGHLRASVEGRSDEVLRYGGIEVHPLSVRAVLLKHPEVLDYQVRQTPDGIEVSALVADRLDADALRAELRAALTDAGLPAPTAAVTCVERLERHPETGKLRRFVPLAK